MTQLQASRAFAVADRAVPVRHPTCPKRTTTSRCCETAWLKQEAIRHMSAYRKLSKR